MNYFERAHEINEETITNRRFFHKHAETGLSLPQTCEYLVNKLISYGITPSKCGNGITATIGKGRPVLLLRADMDALPMQELSGEPFSSPSKKAAHTCGHDMHAAMLLSAARMLKEQEKHLKGTVKLMFQPAEETLEGCKNMIASGILNNPPVDAALAFHVTSGHLPVGAYMYNHTHTMMTSSDNFQIEIKGKGSHGAYPNYSIDPINIGVHTHLALQELISREVDCSHSCVLTIGQFIAGSAANIIPESAVMTGSIHTANKETRKFLLDRIQSITKNTADTYRGTSRLTFTSQVPPLICDSAFTQQIVHYIETLSLPSLQPYPGIQANASEDFAWIAETVPSCYLYLSAGFPDERGNYKAHHPKVRFNEEVLPFGAALYAFLSQKWLNENNHLQNLRSHN